MTVSLALCQASLKWTLPSNIPPYNKQVGETIIVDLKVTRYNNSACSRLSLTHFSSIFEDHTDNFSAVGLLNNVQWGAPRRASAPDEPHLLHQGELLLDQLQTIRGETSRLTRDRRPHCVNLMHNPVLQSRRAEVFRDRGQPGLQERALSPKFTWYQHRAAGVEPRAGAGWLDLFCPLGVWRANTGGGEGTSPNSAAGLEGESTAIENTGAGDLLFADKDTERVSAKTASCSKLELGCASSLILRSSGILLMKVALTQGLSGSWSSVNQEVNAVSRSEGLSSGRRGERATHRSQLSWKESESLAISCLLRDEYWSEDGDDNNIETCWSCLAGSAATTRAALSAFLRMEWM